MPKRFGLDLDTLEVDLTSLSAGSAAGAFVQAEQEQRRRNASVLSSIGVLSAVEKASVESAILSVFEHVQSDRLAAMEPLRGIAEQLSEAMSISRTLAEHASIGSLAEQLSEATSIGRTMAEQASSVTREAMSIGRTMAERLDVKQLIADAQSSHGLFNQIESLAAQWHGVGKFAQEHIRQSDVAATHLQSVLAQAQTYAERASSVSLRGVAETLRTVLPVNGIFESVRQHFDQLGLQAAAGLNVDALFRTHLESQGIEAWNQIQERLQCAVAPSWRDTAAALKHVAWEQVSDLAALVIPRKRKRKKVKEGTAAKTIQGNAPALSNARSLPIWTQWLLALLTLLAWLSAREANQLARDTNELAREQLARGQQGAPVANDWAVVPERTFLYAEPTDNAVVLTELPAGEKVGIFERRKGWVLVEWSAGSGALFRGWMRQNTIRLGHEAIFVELINNLAGSATALVITERAPAKPALQSIPVVVSEPALPALIAAAGQRAEERFVEYFTAKIRNPNTRLAYFRACTSFLDHCAALRVDLGNVKPIHVAAYIEQLGQVRSAPTVKQHLAAIRGLFDFLVVGQILPANPGASVRGPKHVVTEGKTPILDAEEARALFAQFDPTLLPDLRDRAMLGVMAYSFCRVSALAKLRVRDYYRQGTRAWFLFDEKGGRQNKVPVHHQVAEYLEQYLVAAGIGEQRDALLFRSLGRGRRGKNAALTERGLDRREILAMVRRRAAIAGLPVEICCHSFRGTGITNYLQNSGTLEVAARLAGHTSIRTTQLYDRRSKEVEQGEIERVRF